MICKKCRSQMGKLPEDLKQMAKDGNLNKVTRFCSKCGHFQFQYLEPKDLKQLTGEGVSYLFDRRSYNGKN